MPKHETAIAKKSAVLDHEKETKKGFWMIENLYLVKGYFYAALESLIKNVTCSYKISSQEVLVLLDKK